MIHVGENVPSPLPDETGIVLSSIRMTPEHPSTTFPSSARIHYERAYKVYYYAYFKSIGLIRPTSIETGFDQFSANVFRDTAEALDSTSSDTSPTAETVDPTIIDTADFEVARKVLR